MIKLLRWILGLCNHEWEMWRAMDIKDREKKDIVGHLFYFKCKRCGQIRMERNFP